MVDVVDLVPLDAGVQLHEVLHGLDDVLVGEDPLVVGGQLVLLAPAVGQREDPPPWLLPVAMVRIVVLFHEVPLRAQLPLGHVGELVQLLAELVPAHLGQVVALVVEEQVLEQRLRGFRRGRFAGPELSVDVLQCLLAGGEMVLGQGGLDRLGAVEQLEHLLLGPTEGLEEDGHVLTPLAVDAHTDGVALVDFELQPRPAGGDDLGDVDVLVGGLVEFLAEVDAGAPDQLADHHPLGAVDHEGALVGHHGEVAHEDLLFLDLAGLLVDELRLDEQGRGERHVLVLALLHGVLDVLELVLAEDQLVGLGEVLDRRDLRQDLPDPVLQQPVEGFALDPDEVWKGQHLRDLRERDTFATRHDDFRQERPLLEEDGRKSSVRGRRHGNR